MSKLSLRITDDMTYPVRLWLPWQGARKPVRRCRVISHYGAVLSILRQKHFECSMILVLPKRYTKEKPFITLGYLDPGEFGGFNMLEGVKLKVEIDPNQIDFQ